MTTLSQNIAHWNTNNTSNSYLLLPTSIVLVYRIAHFLVAYRKIFTLNPVKLHIFRCSTVSEHAQALVAYCLYLKKHD